MFKDTKFMTARDKELTLKDWERFIKALAKNDLGEVTETEYGAISRKFTKRIYNHLELHCSFIAHYNISGFFGTYFSNPEDTAKFIQQFDEDYRFKSIEYGDTYWYSDPSYADLNEAMCKVVNQYKKQIYNRCSKEEQNRDVAIAHALLKKHGLE